MPSKYNIYNKLYSKPLVIKKFSDSPVFRNNVATEYVFVDNNKEFKSISDELKEHKNIVIYNQANDKLYSLIDGEKFVLLSINLASHWLVITLVKKWNPWVLMEIQMI